MDFFTIHIACLIAALSISDLRMVIYVWCLLSLSYLLYFVFAEPYGTAHFFPGYHHYGNPADSFADVRARHSSPNINQQNMTSEYDGSVTSYSKR